MKSICIIPARGGSKRLPRKNILPLSGKPLLAYSIDAALGANVFEDVVVSSEDAEIIEIAQKYGAKIHKRKEGLSGDKATVFQVFYDFLENSKKGKYEAIAGILPTCPFKSAKQIREAFNNFVSKEGKANLISVTKFDYPPQFGFYLEEDNGLLQMTHPQVFDKTTRSQEIRQLYHNNGAIWMAKVDRYLRDKTFYKGDLMPYEMDAISSFDIDYPYQFEIAEILAQKIAKGEL